MGRGIHRLIVVFNKKNHFVSQELCSEITDLRLWQKKLMLRG